MPMPVVGRDLFGGNGFYPRKWQQLEMVTSCVMCLRLLANFHFQKNIVIGIWQQWFLPQRRVADLPVMIVVRDFPILPGVVRSQIPLPLGAGFAKAIHDLRAVAGKGRRPMETF
jgi:hypothetical protein